MMPTLRTQLLIDAARSKAEAQGNSFTFLHKGDPDSGQILLVTYDAINRKNNIQRQERNWESDGSIWVEVQDGKAFNDTELAAYISRQRKRDQDLWVIEFGGPMNENPFV